MRWTSMWTPMPLALFVCLLGAAGAHAQRSKSRSAAGGFFSDAVQTDDQSAEAPELLLLVGVQTRLDDVELRAGLRSTWFPPKPDAVKRMEAELSIAMRFVVGWTPDPQANASLTREAEEHGGFLILPWQEDVLRTFHGRGAGGPSGAAAFDALDSVDSAKSHAFLLEALQRFNARYIARVEQHVYVRPQQLAAAARQWADASKDYIGCFFRGNRVRSHGRWAELHYRLFPGRYITYAQGGLYVLSRKAVEYVSELPDNRHLRYFTSEDITVGMWMLMFEIEHHDDRRLCADACGDSAVAVRRLWCGGNEDPCWGTAALAELHAKPECAAGVGEGGLATLREHVNFTRWRKNAAQQQRPHAVAVSA